MHALSCAHRIRSRRHCSCAAVEVCEGSPRKEEGTMTATTGVSCTLLLDIFHRPTLGKGSGNPFTWRLSPERGFVSPCKATRGWKCVVFIVCAENRIPKFDSPSFAFGGVPSVQNHLHHRASPERTCCPSFSPVRLIGRLTCRHTASLVSHSAPVSSRLVS